ncbi:MAG: hypothetical protein QXH80_03705, partial [Candidatus Nanoarchaeia archaeon]
MKTINLKTAFAVTIMTLAVAASAAPSTIVYKGRLVDNNGNVVNSSGLPIYFRLYSVETGGSIIYEDRNASVAVIDGLYKCIIGDDTTNYGHQTTSLATALETANYMEIVVDGTVLTPRESFKAVPFALNVMGTSNAANKSLSNLENVAINESLISDSDNTDDLGSATKRWKDAYVAGSISDGTNSITVGTTVTLSGTQTLTNKTINPANNTITLAEGKILVGNASGAAGAVSMSGDVQISSDGTTTIQPNSVVLSTDTQGDYVATITAGNGLSGDASGEGSTPILSVNVDGSTIEINADTLRVKDGGISNNKLAADAVTGDKILNGTITNNDIADGTIENAKLANNKITVTAGDGLKDGGEVALGGSITINIDAGDGIQISSDKVAVDSTVVRTTGNQTIGGVKTFSSIPVLPASDPTSSDQAVRKAYVDNMVNGLSWKNSVKVATTEDWVLNGTDPVDGTAISVGDRVLVKNQATASENGIYIVDVNDWSRATDMDAGTEVPNSAVFVEKGTTNGDTAWVCTTNAPVTIGTTAINFVQFASPGTYTAGAGLTLSGLEFSVGSDSNDGINVTADAIGVNVDNSTIEINSDALRVKNGGISSDKLATSAVTETKIADGAVTENKISNGAVSNNKLATDAVTSGKILDGTISADDLGANCVTSAKIMNGTIATEDIGDSQISEGKIASGAVTETKI